MLTGKHFSCPSKATLHFIRNEQHAMLMTNIHHDTKEFRRWGDEASLAENRFSNYGSYILGRDHSLEGVFQMPSAIHIARRILKRIRAAITVCVRYAVNVGREWSEPRFIRMRLTGQR